MHSKSMVIPVVIEQHAEEAAFLWLLRDNAVHASHYSLADLANLDDRVDAHLDGLRIAGDAGWEICREALVQEEAGEVFAAAVLAFQSGDTPRIQTVLEVGSASSVLSRGLISALGWFPYPQAERHIQQLLTTESLDLVYPQTFYTDLNGLICKTHLIVGVPGVAAQRSTSVA